MLPVPHYHSSRFVKAFRRTSAAAVCSIGLVLAGCESTPETQLLESKPVEELYNDALDALKAGNLLQASRGFDEVERQHPFSEWAPRAQLMSGFAHFEADRYDDAINALDRFIQLHPGHTEVSYAYYLKSLAYYEQIVDVSRDQSLTLRALDALDDVQRRFPDTDYARDAKLKRDLAFDHLAGKEMEIARFYLRQDKLVAALKRFTYVLVGYQTTTHVPEALHRLVETYMALGMVDEAQRFAAVLGHNFPSSEWYADSYALLTGERIEVAINVEEPDLIDRSIDYLFSPDHKIGVVDPDAEIENTGIEAETTTTGLSDSVTFAAIPLPGADASADLASAPSTVPELPVQADPGSAATRLRVDALLASAQENRKAAEVAAQSWQRYLDAPNVDESLRARGASQVETASAAVNYWRARENLLQLAVRQLDGGQTNADERSVAEAAVAEAGLTYWRTVARVGQTETERNIAAKNAADAEQALTYWRGSGRSWLERLLGSST